MTVAARSAAREDGALSEKIEALGPWFHNIDLGGVWTAPDHFLGDYPNMKFRRFEAHLPAELTGKSVLDIGCNAGFYSMEMKRRGAERVVGIDSDDRYLAQARLARRSTSSSSWACSTTFAIPCSRSTSFTGTSPATCCFSSRCSADRCRFFP